VSRLAALLLALTGCHGNTEIDITLTLGPNVEAARFDKLIVDVSGAESYTSTVPLDAHSFDGGQARLAYVPGVHAGTLDIQLSAHSNGVTVAYGQDMSVMVRDGAAVPISIELDCGGIVLCSGPAGDMGLLDGGVDLAGVDLAGADLTAPAGPTPVFYDDFESGNLNKWTPFTGNGGNAVADQTHVHGGQWAAHLFSQPTDLGYPNGELTVGLANAGMPLTYIRVWYFLTAADFSSATEFQVARWYVGSFTNGLQLVADAAHTISDGEIVGGTPGSSPLDWNAPGWTCVEWAIDTNQKRADLFIGREANWTTPDATATWTDSLSMTLLNIGVEGNVPLDLWIDDVYIAASRVGCSTPTP
jgi:hypothetical protein